MSDSPTPANNADPEIPTFATLAADPEIAPLLDFEPVARKVRRPDGWTPELQRELIARLASTGTLQSAVWQMGKHATGAEGLYKNPHADSFRAAWDAALALGRARNGLDAQAPFAGDVPGIIRRRKSSPRQREAAPGEILNEYGEYEDEASWRRRADEARDSVSIKLQRARRLFLHDISACPASRAAFEILTGLPVDWDRAARCLPQADEPWRKPAARDPALLLAGENGWLGEFAHGPDKKAELLAEVNQWRAERGLEPVGWAGESGEEGEPQQ